MVSGGRGEAGMLREVGREDDGGAEEARYTPLQRPGRQGGKAEGKGACDGGGPMEEGAGRGAPGAEPGLSPGRGKKPRVRMLRVLLQKEGWHGGEA